MSSDMKPIQRITRRGPIAMVALVACGVGVAACGTPAVVKPAQTPLPGLKRDIQAAQSAVSQSQKQAQDFGATGVTP